MAYNEKFKLELTSRELELIEYALEEYRQRFGLLQEPIDKIIKKLYSEAYN